MHTSTSILSHDWVRTTDTRIRGSVSAEHGLGFMKATKIGYTKDHVQVELMKKIKGLYDPKGILNPYKYIQV